MQIIWFRSPTFRKWRDYSWTKILPIWCIVVPIVTHIKKEYAFLNFFFNLQKVRWRYQISICFLTMLITIITQASSGNGNRVPNTMVLPLVGLLRLCLWLREICYAKESLLFVIKEIEVLIKASGKPCTKRAANRWRCDAFVRG